MRRPKAFSIADASGAYQGALKNHIVVIVDVIDMSTSLETALELGAVATYGASPDAAKVPVPVNPEKIAEAAARLALRTKSKIVIISEPRFGSKADQQRNCSRLLNKLESLDAPVSDYIPNVGKEVANFTDFKNKVVIAVTDTGGVAYDAAFNKGGVLTTATIARTQLLKGKDPAVKGALRAYNLGRAFRKDISVVAASSNSLEDVLASKYICDLINGLS